MYAIGDVVDGHFSCPAVVDILPHVTADLSVQCCNTIDVRGQTQGQDCHAEWPGWTTFLAEPREVAASHASAAECRSQQFGAAAKVIPIVPRGNWGMRRKDRLCGDVAFGDIECSA